MTILSRLRHSKGPEVTAWQELLVVLSYLQTQDVDGDFGSRTEKATIQFQLARGLDGDGSVGDETRAAASKAPRTPSTGLFDARWHFVQAKHFQRPVVPRVVTTIGLHSMQHPNRPDTAEGVAAWFAGLRGDAPEASAHANVDQDSIVLSVKPEDIAWAAQGGNWHGYHIEQAGYAAWTREQWLAEPNRSTLELAASHISLACKHFGLPIAALQDAEVAALVRDALVRQGKANGTLSGHPGGIAQHIQFTRVWQAWAKYGLPNPRKAAKPWWPTHVDCGDGYPIDFVIEEARRFAGTTDA